jgi:hypothetical protein
MVEFPLPGFPRDCRICSQAPSIPGTPLGAAGPFPAEDWGGGGRGGRGGGWTRTVAGDSGPLNQRKELQCVW